jgi:Flp pilus assembly secretin CpaC
MKYSFKHCCKFLLFIAISSIASFVYAEKSTDNPNKITVDIDFMQGLEFKKPAGQIILGNPIIADITVRDEQYIFISGKSPGRTNMLVYGRDGKISEQYVLVVRDPNAYLTVYQGSQSRSHFDCEPLCQRVLRIEDSSDVADAQRAKIAAQIDMIDGRARQAKADETLEQQQKTGQ